MQTIAPGFYREYLMKWICCSRYATSQTTHDKSVVFLLHERALYLNESFWTDCRGYKIMNWAIPNRELNWTELKFLKENFELNWIYNSEKESELNWILKLEYLPAYDVKLISRWHLLERTHSLES